MCGHDGWEIIARNDVSAAVDYHCAKTAQERGVRKVGNVTLEYLYKALRVHI